MLIIINNNPKAYKNTTAIKICNSVDRTETLYVDRLLLINTIRPSSPTFDNST